MPSSFTIAASTNTILLQPGRPGQVTFAVSNTSGQLIRGRAILVPENPLPAQWLQIAGEIERDWPIGDTHQYEVRVQAPANAAAGNYIFRLDMVGVENPGELYSLGPSIALEVSTLQPAPPLKLFPWWVAAAAGAVVLAVVLTIVFWPRHVAYSLLDHAAEAKWTSSNTNEPLVHWPRSGATCCLALEECTGSILEDGHSCGKGIYTHPVWGGYDGWVQGEFAVPKLGKNQHFTARIGFKESADPYPGSLPRTNGVDVWVSWNGQVLYHKVKRWSDALAIIDVDLSRFAGQRGALAIKVGTHGDPNYDQLCWIDPRIDRP